MSVIVTEITSNTFSEIPVTVSKDTLLPYPELWLEVWLTGTPYEQKQFAEMFVRARCYRAKSPETADVVIFAGGPDIDPMLYGVPDEMCHTSVELDHRRDIEDLELYRLCYDKGIPMFGICRGAQLLGAMNGADLYQDVDGHQGAHPMYDRIGKKVIQSVSSVHHQMVIDTKNIGMEVLGTSRKSTKRHLNRTDYEEGVATDVEAFFFRDSCSIGVQGHPEYRNYTEYTIWCLNLLDKFINENPDITLEGVKHKNRRIKPELLSQRISLKIKELN